MQVRYWRNFVLLFAAAFLVYGNFYTSFTTLPLYIFHLGGTEFQAGLQNTIFFLTAVVLRFYFGPLADSKGRKLPLLIGAFVFATAPLLFILSHSLWLLYLARMYQAIGLATFLATGASLLGDMAPAKRMGSYVGAYRFIINLSLLVGPFIALWVIEVSNFFCWYIASAIVGMVALLLVAMIKPPPLLEKGETGFWQRTLNALNDKKLWTIYTGFMLLAVAYGSILTFVSIYIAKVTQISNPGIYFTYFGLAACVAYLSTGYLSDRFGRAMVAWPALMLLGLGAALLLYLALKPAVLLFSSLFAGLGFAGSFSTLNAWLIEAAEKSLRATALSIMESIIDLFIAVGSLLFGIACGWVGLGVSYALTGTVIVVFALLFWLMALRRWRLGSQGSSL